MAPIWLGACQCDATYLNDSYSFEAHPTRFSLFDILTDLVAHLRGRAREDEQQQQQQQQFTTEKPSGAAGLL